MVYGIVYLITNTVNGKCYVGQTIRGAQRRFKEHCAADSYIGKAIRRHGANVFRIEEIACCLDEISLNCTEVELIRAYGSTIPHGYNIGWRSASLEEKTQIKHEETTEDIGSLLDRMVSVVPIWFKNNDWLRIRWSLEMLACLKKGKPVGLVDQKVAKTLNLFCEQWRFYQRSIGIPLLS